MTWPTDYKQVPTFTAGGTEPLYCSQGGVPYNKVHLDRKDAEISRLRAENADALADAVRLHQEKMEFFDKHLAVMVENEQLLAALKAVVAVADRRTDEFDAARAAIAKAEEHSHKPDERQKLEQGSRRSTEDQAS